MGVRTIFNIASLLNPRATSIVEITLIPRIELLSIVFVRVSRIALRLLKIFDNIIVISSFFWRAFKSNSLLSV